MVTSDIVKSSGIEGEKFNPDEVRSSIARRLGIDIAGLTPASRNVDGVVELILLMKRELQIHLQSIDHHNL